MRQPFFMPPQPMMPQMPIAPRFPMYAPYMMRMPMNTMPMNAMPQIPPQFSGVPAAATATAATGAPRLEGFLAGANSLFENAQKFTPYIQQATPMFKNLPALWRMYRGFKNAPDATDPLESSTIVAPVERPPRQSRRSRQQSQSRQYTPITSKPSVPMIFQPPFE